MSTETISLPISGMTCAACSRNVERAVKKTDGVESVAVNLANEKATIMLDPEKIGLKDILQNIENSGYGVTTATAELPITGMTCAACVRNVERPLKRLDGVLEVNVNLATEKAHIQYIPGVTTHSDFIHAVESAGYGVVDTSDALDPVDAERKARQQEVERQKRLITIGVIFTIPLLILSMGQHIPFLMEAFPWLMWEGWMVVFFLLATPVYIVLGRQYIVGAVKSLRNGTANMDVLVAMGSSAAYWYSVVVLVGNILGYEEIFGRAEYFESSAVILTLITVGKYLEARAKGRTSEAIQKLMRLAPKTAYKLENGEEIELPVEQIVISDQLVIRPGGHIPVDGIVIDGHSSVDESMLTGESLPVNKKNGAEVIAGTINKQGRLVIEATRVGSQTALAQIIRIVEQAQGSKAPIQRIADQISAIFVPVVLLLALVTFVGWLLVGQVGFTQAMLNTITVLIIACPCALGLATPTAIMVGTGRGAENGILFRNSEALETAHKLDTIVLDKTGTITRGEPQVTDVIPFGISENELLGLAGSAERGSEHPLGEAIVISARNQGITLEEPKEFVADSGRGIRAYIGTDAVAIGSPKFIKEQLPEALTDEIRLQIEKLQTNGRTTVLVTQNQNLVGMIGIADTIKATSPDAVAELTNLGLEVVMLTGDNQQTAKAIAHEVGIQRFYADVLPDEKANIINQLQGENKIVAMVGDGINDAPALAHADVGLAIGTGTDVAMETADITLMRGDLLGVFTAISLSKITMRTIKQNLFWAFVYNIILIPIAMLGLLVPMFAAFAMAFSSVFVVSNSLRLKRKKVEIAISTERNVSDFAVKHAVQ